MNRLLIACALAALSSGCIGRTEPEPEPESIFVWYDYITHVSVPTGTQRTDVILHWAGAIERPGIEYFRVTIPQGGSAWPEQDDVEHRAIVRPHDGVSEFEVGVQHLGETYRHPDRVEVFTTDGRAEFCLGLSCGGSAGVPVLLSRAP